jgi:negative regulator of replication initiation
MKSITIHDLDSDLYKSIQSQATSQGLSLNKAIKQLLRKSLGLPHKYAEKRDFSKFVGVWSKKEADEFDKIINEEFENIDEEDWK